MKTSIEIIDTYDATLEYLEELGRGEEEFTSETLTAASRKIYSEIECPCDNLTWEDSGLILNNGVSVFQVTGEEDELRKFYKAYIKFRVEDHGECEEDIPSFEKVEVTPQMKAAGKHCKDLEPFISGNFCRI